MIFIRVGGVNSANLKYFKKRDRFEDTPKSGIYAFPLGVMDAGWFYKPKYQTKWLGTEHLAKIEQIKDSPFTEKLLQKTGHTLELMASEMLYKQKWMKDYKTLTYKGRLLHHFNAKGVYIGNWHECEIKEYQKILNKALFNAKMTKAKGLNVEYGFFEVILVDKT